MGINKGMVTLAVVGISCITVLGIFMNTDSFNCQRIVQDENVCPVPNAGWFTYKRIRSTVLASSAGSGNTWTRYLLTTASGILTASLYNIETVVSLFPRTRAYRVIVVKSHEPPDRTRDYFPYDRCLLLIRDPYDAFLADFNRLGVKSKEDYSVHNTIRPAKDFKTDWPKYVSTRMARWLSFNMAWALSCKPPMLHVLVYSRMMENLGHELDLVFRFLNESIITPKIHCALRYREGKYHRADHDWQKPLAVFTQEQKTFLNKAIDKVQATLQKTTGESFEDFQSWKR